MMTLLRSGRSLDDLEASYKGALEAFIARRSKYLLYPRPN